LLTAGIPGCNAASTSTITSASSLTDENACGYTSLGNVLISNADPAH